MTLRVCAAAMLTALCAAGAPAAQEHAYTPADIENGTRVYRTTCAGCHGEAGDGVAGAELASGQFRRGTSDVELIRIVQSGIPGTAMPPHGLTDAEAATVVAYLRNMAAIRRGAPAEVLRGAGDAARGRAIFDGKGACATCHRVRGRGSRLAPDLSDVGATRPLSELHQSLLDPGATIRSANRVVRVVTRDGMTMTGRLLNQDSASIQMLDAGERLVSLSKQNLREYAVVRTSPMPSYRDTLTAEEIDDLVGYLATLRGVSP